MQILEFIWWGSLVILLGYHFFIFRIRRSVTNLSSRIEHQGVSILIAVRNGSDRLIENLPHLLFQDYPLYEVIVVDDHSEMEEKKKLEEMIFRLPRVILHHSDRKPGKKQALSLGIEKANFGYVLCTDADCRPSGPGWIQNMISHSSGHDLVLGYSPYNFEKGLLNLLIRFETVMTGIQYLSWAMVGKSYMGVGRNMLYAREAIQKSDPYHNHTDIPYGDDDLWVQQASALCPVYVCIDKASHMYSVPASSWAGWFRQKHRHLSAAHHYARGKWWQPGLYGLALVSHWALLPILIAVALNGWVIGFFFFGLTIRWYTYNKWTLSLGDKDTVIWYPLLEVGYALYLAGMGLFTLAIKKKKWN